jgi:anti-anti-sigma regulatory factor
MNIVINSVKVLDHQAECLFIVSTTDLTTSFTGEIREAVEFCLQSDCPVIYLDARQSNEADLSGINEVIHAHYTLKQAGKKMIFAYTLNSSVEKWVAVTGLDRFIETASVPHIKSLT